MFKKLIYEMRFDQVSAEYALFGQFFVGLRVPLAKLGEWAEGSCQDSSSYQQSAIGNTKIEELSRRRDTSSPGSLPTS